jgi:Trypsin-co-occurring domain 2
MEAVENDALRAFVTSTLNAVAAGIADAQPTARIASAHGTGQRGFNAPAAVTFDIAVNAKRADEAKGGLTVEVFSIGANAGGVRSTENSTVSRIQFSVPARFKSGVK